MTVTMSVGLDLVEATPRSRGRSSTRTRPASAASRVASSRSSFGSALTVMGTAFLVGYSFRTQRRVAAPYRAVVGDGSGVLVLARDRGQRRARIRATVQGTHLGERTQSPDHAGQCAALGVATGHRRALDH